MKLFVIFLSLAASSTALTADDADGLQDCFIPTSASALAIGALLIIAVILVVRILRLSNKARVASNIIDNSKIELKSMETRLDAMTLELKEKDEKLKDKDAAQMGLEENVKKLAEEISKLKKDNERQEKLIENLRESISAETFDGRLPICSNCKDIRDSHGYWHPIEEYIKNLSASDFSHSLCPECAQKLYPDMFKDGKKPHTLTWK